MVKTTLMAVAVIASLIAGPATAVSVINGDFETVDSRTGTFGGSLDQLATSGRSWDVFQTIPGWFTADGAGIEVQTNRTLRSIDAHSGQHYVELDSHGLNSNSSMGQWLALEQGAYELSFWYSPRTKDVNTNGIEFDVVSAGSSLANGLVTGPSTSNGTSVGNWTQFKTLFVVEDKFAKPTLITFTANGTENTLGGFIDDVEISAVPLPASVLLMFMALAGLYYTGRKTT